MKTLLNLSLAMIVMILFVACGNSFKQQTLSGKYGGKDWSFKSGKVTKNPLDTSVFVVELADVEKGDPCGITEGANVITTTCPQVIGEHEFGMLKLRFANFTSAGSNLMATDGIIEIISIDWAKKELKGRMIAKYDDSNSVNGDFTAKICNDNTLDNILNNVVDSLKNTTDTLKKK